MKGSKYTDEQRERALALIASGLTATAAAKQMGIPKSTVCHWYNTAEEDDEDFRAFRTEERRRLVKRCNKIVTNSIGAIDRKVMDAARGTKLMNEGLRVIEQAAEFGAIALKETDVALLKSAYTHYTGVGLRDLAATLKAIDEKTERLENQISGGANDGVQVEFAEATEDFAE